MFVRIVVTELGPVPEKFMSSNTSTNNGPHEDPDFEGYCCKKCHIWHDQGYKKATAHGLEWKYRSEFRVFSEE